MAKSTITSLTTTINQKKEIRKKLYSQFMKNVTWLFVGVCTLVLNSCNQNVIVDNNNPLQNETWSYEQQQDFIVPIEDTTIQYNIYINIRHSFHFEWRNLWVEIKTQFPSGKKLSKRVNLALSEADGKWFGDCSSDDCFIQIPIQENALFPEKGNYTFSIAQDMRINPLRNISNVGLKVEKVLSTKTEN